MKLDELKRNWEALGEQDALWAILSVPEKRGGGWDLDAFFATGRAEVAELLDLSRRLDPPRERGTALDFGCGVGRISQALAEHFDRVIGVDVAESMVREARRLNRHGDACT